jgi:ABC transporter, ATP-binding protein
VELKIRNVGKIDSADIEIKGITIIAGLNGTGKSTVSRSLFAMFHSFSNISHKIRLEKEDAIKRQLEYSGDMGIMMYSVRMLAASLVGYTDENSIKEILTSSSGMAESPGMEYLIKKIIMINSTYDTSLLRESVLENFKAEFNGNIANIRNSKESEFELKVKDLKIKVIFDNRDEVVELENEKELVHEVVYIDDPFIIDSYNTRGIKQEYYHNGYLITRNHRETLLLQYINNKNLTLVDKANIKDKLKVIYKKINDTLGSDMSLFETDNDDNMSRGTRTKGLSLDSLSSGMKTFYLIKSLIDNGTIVQNGTLILDEPEVHLHPDWQVTLAEVIVLLQREMGLHILINTHSPYFLRAIEVFSGKYDTEDVVKYYLSYNEGDNAKMKDVTFNISEIYKVLSGPLQRIENEGYNDRD